MVSTSREPVKISSIVLGVGVVVTREGYVVLGRRLLPKPCWSLPGGKIEPLETIEDCGRRELHEETGLRGGNEARIISVANMRAPDLHTIVFGVMFPQCVGEPSVREPDKFATWEWFSLSSLPDDLFLPSRTVLDGYLDRAGHHTKSSETCRFADVSFFGMPEVQIE